MTDKFHYDALIDDAMRGVVRRVLKQVAESGLPGAHHFYLSFRTADPGVEVPAYLREKYPDEMTVVLQHQYWGLEVTDEHFEVTVSFNRRNERLKVPFAALSAFVDPSVRVGLQFTKRDASGAAVETKPALAAPDAKTGPAEEAPAQDTTAAPGEATPAPAAGGKVVTLDAFRKK